VISVLVARSRVPLLAFALLALIGALGRDALHAPAARASTTQFSIMQDDDLNGRPYSAQLYRELYLRGHEALAETGHGKDLILAGETAPLGSNGTGARTPMRPAQFIRELFCLQPNLTPYAGPAATARGCGLFSQFAVQGG
jgi:hypothetical protein